MLCSSALIAIGLLARGCKSFSSSSTTTPLQRISSLHNNNNHNHRHHPNNNINAIILHGTVTDTDTETTQDTNVDAPSSVVFYDDYLDPDNPTGVVCARGVCVLPDDEEIDWSKPPSYADTAAGTTLQQKEQSIIDKFLSSYLGPRLLLAFASILYGTNFPLGAIMNEALPPSAATSARMLMASLALSPFLFKLEGKLAPKALLCGCFTALGYITQSLSLVDISPAKVSFLGK